ncbi:hypothetical protein [Rhodococcus sp. IEGM 1379]|uniref:hypothetical protein n=1 Tax=Rhodococcus sp. IEGM 1379 TaxID=3047086 RepID=UPI0024B6BF7F|nr:hypothetical protein [Rhodococcus sp. IEGM 1379]MDI9914377.1 hypothetical protein [Rhodococcus sp. IEGM 1379]
MNSDQIRAEAIDRIARAHYRQQFGDAGYVWEETTETIRNHHRVTAAFAVDALGDLLPTITRYGVANPVNGEARFVDYTLESCKDFATEFETHVIQQHLTEWTSHE